jgi:hypothetical protein
LWIEDSPLTLPPDVVSRFTYHGFRFVQVVASNFWYPALSDIEGHQIYSSLPTVGSINFYSGTTAL